MIKQKLKHKYEEKYIIWNVTKMTEHNNEISETIGCDFNTSKKMQFLNDVKVAFIIVVHIVVGVVSILILFVHNLFCLFVYYLWFSCIVFILLREIFGFSSGLERMASFFTKTNFNFRHAWWLLFRISPLVFWFIFLILVSFHWYLCFFFLFWRGKKW